jgi:hypothetical protein
MLTFPKEPTKISQEESEISNILVAVKNLAERMSIRSDELLLLLSDPENKIPCEQKNMSLLQNLCTALDSLVETKKMEREELFEMLQA